MLHSSSPTDFSSPGFPRVLQVPTCIGSCIACCQGCCLLPLQIRARSQGSITSGQNDTPVCGPRGEVEENARRSCCSSDCWHALTCTPAISFTRDRLREATATAAPLSKIPTTKSRRCRHIRSRSSSRGQEDCFSAEIVSSLRGLQMGCPGTRLYRVLDS